MKKSAFHGINIILCKSAKVINICQMSQYSNNLRYSVAIVQYNFIEQAKNKSDKQIQLKC